MKILKIIKDERVVYLLLTTLILFFIRLFQPAKAVIVIEVALTTFKNVIGIIISVMILVGLASVWLKPQGIIKFLGKESGFKGLLFASVIGILLTGPLYAVFPLLKTLREKGARGASIAAIITAWGGIRLPLIPLEIHFLGLSFFFLRNFLLFLLTIPTSLLIEKTEAFLKKI